MWANWPVELLSVPGADANLFEEHREAFAKYLARNPMEPLTAALKVTPNTLLAQRYAAFWTNDPIVQSLIQDIRNNHPEELLPTKEEVALEVLDMARKSTSVDGKIKAYKLYGEFMGHIAKPAEVVVDNRTQTIHNTQNNIEFVSAADWEKAALGQQERLAIAANAA